MDNATIAEISKGISLFMDKATLIEISRNAFIPLLSAFSGVWLAYRLQARKEKRKEKDQRLGILAKTYITLLKKLNTIALVAKQMSQYIDTESGTITMQQFVIPEEYVLDDLSLYFLALDNPDLYQMILQSHDASVSMMTCLSIYNGHVASMQRYHALNTHGKLLSDALEIIPYVLQSMKNLHEYAMKKYKQKKFVSIEIGDLDMNKIANSVRVLGEACKQMEINKDKAKE